MLWQRLLRDAILVGSPPARRAQTTRHRDFSSSRFLLSDCAKGATFGGGAAFE
jgi:hypothetical protein